MFLGSAAIDAWMLSIGLVKMEVANAFQLEYHALSRDGQVLAAAPLGYYADTLHNWAYHLLLLVSPRLEVVAGALNVVHYAAIAILFLGIRSRIGLTAAVGAAGCAMVTPVAAILSKHVISTAFVPLTSTLFLLAFLDACQHRRARDLGWVTVWLAVLLALNHGHIWMLGPYALAAWRVGSWRPPMWSLTIAAIPAFSAGADLYSWFGTPAWDAWWALSEWWPETDYPTVDYWSRRAMFVEPGMVFMTRNLGLLYVLLGWGLWRAWTDRDALPPGLIWLVAMVIPLAFANSEAIIIWQVFLFALVGWGLPRHSVHRPHSPVFGVRPHRLRHALPTPRAARRT